MVASPAGNYLVSGGADFQVWPCASGQTGVQAHRTQAAERVSYGQTSNLTCCVSTHMQQASSSQAAAVANTATG